MVLQPGLRRVLSIVDLLADAGGAVAPSILLPALLDAVPADSVVLTRSSSQPRRTLTEPPDLLSPAAARVFEREAYADPLVQYTRGTIEVAAGIVVRRSDVQNRAAYRRLGTYQRVFRQVGADHQLAVAMRLGRSGGACIAFNRSGADFDDLDLEVAEALRPRLAHTLADAAQGSVWASVTRREAETLDLLCQGLTNQQIALRLEISPRTVGKHLENVYLKLRTRNRVNTAAVWQARHC